MRKHPRLKKVAKARARKVSFVGSSMRGRRGRGQRWGDGEGEGEAWEAWWEVEVEGDWERNDDKKGRIKVRVRRLVRAPREGRREALSEES